MSLRVLIVAAALSACGSSPQTPPAGPLPAAPASATSLERDCPSFADYRREHCKADRASVLEQCHVLARLAEVGQCIPQGRKSYDCGGTSEATCSTAECCNAMISQCDDPDIAFDHCLRGYCGGHTGNPDCKTFEQMFGGDTDPPASPSPSPSGAQPPQS
jgi:hypothetical protein